MAHDVFVSYSSKDKTIADATVATLEHNGVRCWVAPRDIKPGDDWGEKIIDAINGTKVMVLIFSSNANASQQIKREVELAVHRGVAVIPMRVEEVLPAKSLEYFLSTPHWLDAFSPPLESHLDHLASVIKQILADPAAGQSYELPKPPPRRKRLPLWQIGTGLAIAIALLLLWRISSRLTDLVKSAPGGAGSSEIARSSDPPKPANPLAAWVGKWKLVKVDFTGQQNATGAMVFALTSILVAAFTNPDFTVYSTTDAMGSYRMDGFVTDSGTYQFNGTQLTMTSAHTHQSDTVQVLRSTLAQPLEILGGAVGDSSLALNAPGKNQTIWFRKPPADPKLKAGILGTWVNKMAYAESPTKWHACTIEFLPGAKYKVRFERTETGVIDVDGDHFKKSSGNSPPEEGKFALDGPDTMILVVPTSRSVWKREK